MEAFLILVLFLLLLALWRGGKGATEELRQQIGGQRRELDSLKQEIAFLRSQLGALLKQQSTAPERPPAPAAEATAKSPEAPPQPVAPPIQPLAAPKIEETVKPEPPKSAPAQQPPAPPIAAFQAPPAAPIPPPPPIPAFAPQPTAADRRFSLEQTLGGNWLNKIGIAILVIGLAFFLALKLQTWGPAGKVLCGFAVSVVLLGFGVWLERKPTYRIFARGGIGGGWALAFFTTFAMHHVAAARVLPSLAADLVLMMLVAAGMVAHSLRYRSQTVTGLAFLLAYATLLTSHLEAASGTVAFSLSASVVLAIALVIVTTQRHWVWLELTGLGAVYLSHFVWLTRVLPANHWQFAEFWPSTALILLYWLTFRLAYILRTPVNQQEENISSLSAVLNSVGVLGLLKYQAANPQWAFGALLALGALEMVMAFRVRARRHQAFVVLSTIAVVLIVCAIPFKFHGLTWPVVWLVQAQVLAISGLRLNEPVFRRLGLCVGLVTGAVLAFRQVIPLVFMRLFYPDPNRHDEVAVALALAAALYWIHAEIYPRRWPQIAADKREAFALRIVSWLGLAAAAAVLWIEIPELWLPLGWLALMLLLSFLAHRYGAVRLSIEADLLTLSAAAVLFFGQLVPLILFRLNNPDPLRHATETTVLALAALALWTRTEAYPRILPAVVSDSGFDIRTWQSAALPVTSWLAAAAAASALWVVLPSSWVVPGWLALVLALGLVADWLKSPIQAIQADFLALLSLPALLVWDFWTEGWWDHRAPLIVSIALLYAGMRRRTVLAGSRNYVPATYSWAATLLMSFAAWDLSSSLALIPVWCALGFALFELGRFTRKGFLRWQGFFLTALALGRYLVVDITSPAVDFAQLHLPLALFAEHFNPLQSLLVEVLILALAGYALLERTRNREICPRHEHIAGLAADALGTLSIALWFAFRFPSYWVPIPGGEAWVSTIWAAMATLLIALAWLLRRRAFLAQAMALAAAAALRTLFLDLFTETESGFWHGALFHLGVTALLLLAALPFAFLLRKGDRFANPTFVLPPEYDRILRRSEQWFFFLAFALCVIALAAKLSFSHITIAWSLLGLAVFLFALAVGERSFRLAGLSLLLVCVAKILLMDVWGLPPSERYITLIVLGLALLAVSFLYTRFASVMRKFL